MGDDEDEAEYFVCICIPTTDKEIKLAVENGATTIQDIRDELLANTCCQTCTEEIEKIIENKLSELNGVDVK